MNTLYRAGRTFTLKFEFRYFAHDKFAKFQLRQFLSFEELFNDGFYN